MSGVTSPIHRARSHALTITSWLRERWIAFAVAAVSWTYSVLLVNRAWWTDLGEASFPRIWAYFVSWGDFGFARRTLLGTILVQSGLSDSIGDPYVFARGAYTVLLTIAFLIVLWAIVTCRELYSRPLVVVGILLSPAVLPHLGYAIGSQDVALACLCLLSVLFVPSRALLVVLGLSIAGILIHDLYVLLVPGIAAIRLLASSRQGLRALREPLVLLTSAGLTFVFTVSFGRITVTAQEYSAVVNPRIAGDFHAPGTNGFFELASTIGENQELGLSLHSLVENWQFVSLPLAYLALVVCTVVIPVRVSISRKVAVAVALLIPLTATLFAFDFYRWVSLSALLGLVALIAFVRWGLLDVPPVSQLLLALACVTAPIGAFELTRPFPVHQWVVERLT